MTASTTTSVSIRVGGGFIVTGTITPETGGIVIEVSIRVGGGFIVTTQHAASADQVAFQSALAADSL